MILHILSYLAVLVSGASGTWFLTEAAKQVNLFKLSTASAAILRGVAGAFALLSVVILGLVNHDLQPTDLQHLLLPALTFAVNWLGSHNIHKLTNKWAAAPVATPPAPPADGASA